MIVAAGVRGQKLKVLLADRPGNECQDRLSLCDFLRDEQAGQWDTGFTDLRDSLPACRFRQTRSRRPPRRAVREPRPVSRLPDRGSQEGRRRKNPQENLQDSQPHVEDFLQMAVKATRPIHLLNAVGRKVFSFERSLFLGIVWLEHSSRMTPKTK